MDMSGKIHCFQLPGIILIAGPVFDPFYSRTTKSGFIIGCAGHEQL